MGMTYTFKDANGNMVFSIEGVNSVSDNEISLESMYSNIVKKGNEIDNALDKFNFVSNTRAMEALGYVKGAGFGKNVVNVGKYIGDKIVKFFDDIIEFFKGVLAKINNKLNSNAAKHAAAEVVKKMTNPSDKDSAMELAKVTSIIESDNMGLYVVLKKNYNTLNEIKNFIGTVSDHGKINDSDLFKIKQDSIKTKLVELEEDAKHVSSSEKRKEAIAFYKEMSSIGAYKMGEDIKHELKDLEARKAIVVKVWKSLDQRHIDEGDDNHTNSVVANYHLTTAFYKVLTKYVAVINSLVDAAFANARKV